MFYLGQVLLMVKEHWKAACVILLVASAMAWHSLEVRKAVLAQKESDALSEKHRQESAELAARKVNEDKERHAEERVADARKETESVKQSYLEFLSRAGATERVRSNQYASVCRGVSEATGASDAGDQSARVGALLARTQSLAERAEQLGRLSTQELNERDKWIAAATVELGK